MSTSQEYERWKAMGNEIRQIRDSLITFICNPEYQRLTTAVLTDILLKAVRQIDRFRCKTEDRMFEKVCPPQSDCKKWIEVFYGNEIERW